MTNSRHIPHQPDRLRRAKQFADRLRRDSRRDDTTTPILPGDDQTTQPVTEPVTQRDRSIRKGPAVDWEAFNTTKTSGNYQRPPVPPYVPPRGVRQFYIDRGSDFNTAVPIIVLLIGVLLIMGSYFFWSGTVIEPIAGMAMAVLVILGFRSMFWGSN